MEELQSYAKEHDLKIFPISAATGQGVRELLDEVVRIRDTQDPAPVVCEREYFEMAEEQTGPGYTIEKTGDHEFEGYGPVLDKMLGYTHLESEKGFDFFQKFLRDRGIIDALEQHGVEEGDTIYIGGIAFDFFH